MKRVRCTSYMGGLFDRSNNIGQLTGTIDYLNYATVA